MLAFFWEAWVWFSEPTVRPFLGALAAVVAAMTIQPGSWLKPWRALRRIVQVMVVWLVMAFLLGLLPFARGEGFGWAGGRGQGGAGTHSGAGPGERPGVLVSRPGVVVLEGDFPEGFSANVVLAVEFVPLGTDPNRARDLACDVRLRASNQIVQIRTATMPEFETELRRVFKEAPVPADTREPLASLRQTPFPGTGVLQKVETLLREEQPRLGLQRDQ